MRRRSVLALIGALPVLAGLRGSATPAPPAGLLSDALWEGAEGDTSFGGFSALRLSADGRSFVALSDRGRWLRGHLSRDGLGGISAIHAGPLTALRGTGTAPLRPGRNDSEGLAIAPDGTAYVSFEGVARVLRYARLEGPAENLPNHPDFARMGPNSALEALAIDPRGRLWTLPERSGRLDRPFPTYVFAAGDWHRGPDLPRRGGFLAVAADFDAAGRLYLLERAFLGLAGFATRLRRFTLQADKVSDEETLLETPPGLHGNLEGLSLWADARGLVASMVADDNQNFLLETRIVEYRLPH